MLRARCDEDHLNYVDDVKTVYDEYGIERTACPSCIDNYRECEDCGRLFKSDLLIDGRCPDCTAEVTDEEVKEEIA